MCKWKILIHNYIKKYLKVSEKRRAGISLLLFFRYPAVAV